VTTISAAPSRLTGWQGAPEYFRFIELNHLDLDPVVDVLHRRVLGVIYRGVFGLDACRSLVQRFWDSPARKRRSGEVCESLGSYVGAYHYHKPTVQYLRESAEIEGYLESVLDVPGEPTTRFRNLLRDRLAHDGVVFRLAQQDGKPGCPVLIRHWNADGQFALQPHEDASQCREPRQAGFEVQRTLEYCVCAVNVCLENGEHGRLVMWNMIPDDESKSRLGLYYAGSPYPPEVLDGIGSVWLDVRPGDIYVFNGEHVHAVEASTGGGRRTTMAWNMGFCDDRNVVTWT
jgi:hypothetical protein